MEPRDPRLQQPITEPQDDLQEFLQNLRKFWDRWGMHVLVTVLVVLGVIAAVRWYRYLSETAREKAWGDVSSSTSPDAFLAVAQEQQGSRPAAAALAYLRAADLFLEQARTPASVRAARAGGDTEGSIPGLTTLTTNTPLSPEEDAAQRKSALDRARAAAQEVLNLPAIDQVFRFNADLIIASVDETQGNWDDAARRYRDIQSAAGQAYPGIRAEAANRLALLDRLKTPVTFAPAPTTQPDDAAVFGDMPMGADARVNPATPAATTDAPASTQPASTRPASAPAAAATQPSVAP